MKRVERNGLRVVPQLEDVIGKPLAYKIHLSDMPATRFLDSPAYQALYNNGQAIETFEEFKSRRAQFEELQKQVARDMHVPFQHVKETVNIAVGTRSLQSADASTETDRPDVVMTQDSSTETDRPDVVMTQDAGTSPRGPPGGGGGAIAASGPGPQPPGERRSPRGGTVQEGGSSGSNQPPPGAPGAGAVLAGGTRNPLDWFDEMATNERRSVKRVVEFINKRNKPSLPQIFFNGRAT